MIQNNESNERYISYYCSYVPVEIITASGLIPKRTLPVSDPAIGDSHLHPNTCSLIKSLLATALESKMAGSSGFVFANSCDGMRKMFDVWQAYAADIQPFFVDVPKKNDLDSVDYFASELRRLVSNLETAFDLPRVTNEKLNDAIKDRNNFRLQMLEVFDLQKDENKAIPPRAFFNFLVQAANSVSTDIGENIKEITASAGSAPAPDGPGIVLCGNAIDTPDIAGLIESLGGRLAAVDTCLGVRHYDRLVDEDSDDPIHALAERYLRKHSCPRMDDFNERFQRLKELVDFHHADAFIYTAIKQCDCGHFDAPMLAENFSKLNIPFLFIENDYVWSGMEQARTRVQAFFEIIRQRGE